MYLHQIFDKIKSTSKRTDKEKILKENDSELLRNVLEHTYNPYKQYYVVKLPKIKYVEQKDHEAIIWEMFLLALNRLELREVTGNDAVAEIVNVLKYAGEERSIWMQKVLKRHLNIGITANTINKVYGDIIPTFKVQLAKIFDPERLKYTQLVATEPKLDGVRCIAISKNGVTNLYSRNGKSISDNYQDTIIKDLNAWSLDNAASAVFDGELMGSDFTATVSHFRKKTGADTSSHFYHIFDWMPYEDWINKKSSMNCQTTREKLEDMCLQSSSKFLRIVKRDVVFPDKIKQMHDIYVREGYEGVMIKTLDTNYKFGRGFNVMKLKDFYDADLEVVGFEEGSGKYENSLGAIIVKNKEIRVNVGSGFTDEERKVIWENRGEFRGKIVEVRYQEETPDGSLRFPTFRGWRYDKT